MIKYILTLIRLQREMKTKLADGLSFNESLKAHHRNNPLTFKCY